MKKLLIVLALAGIGYFIYRQVMASRAEEDLWTEATAAPDLGPIPTPDTTIEEVVVEKSEEG